MNKKIITVGLLTLGLVAATTELALDKGLSIIALASTTNSCTIATSSKTAMFGTINTKTQSAYNLKGTFTSNSAVGKMLYTGSSTNYNWCNLMNTTLEFGLGGKLTSVVVTYAFSADKGSHLPSDNRFDNTFEIFGKSGSNYVSICSVALSPKGLKITGGLIDNKNEITADKTKTISQSTYTKLNAYKEYKIYCTPGSYNGSNVFAYFNVKLNWTCA